MKSGYLSLSELVERVSALSGLNKKITKNRIRHWARKDFLCYVSKIGNGTGTRRLYHVVAVEQCLKLIEAKRLLWGGGGGGEKVQNL